MTKNIFISIILIAFLALSAPAFAEIDFITYRTTNTFSIATGASAFNMCQCESVADSFVITNTGQFANQFVITVDNPDMVSLSQSSFELLPGVAEPVFIYINAPCNKAYTKTITLTVTDIFGNQESFEKTWTVAKCQNLEATLAVQSADNKPCTPQTYEILVNNTGVFTETYDVLFGGETYDDYFNTSFSSLIIPAGGQGLVTSTMTLDCAISGNITIPFQVQATQNNLVADLSHTFIIEPDYGFSLNIPETNMCAGNTGAIPVIITNTASFTNTFDLSLEGPSFLTLEQSNITLESGEEKVIMLSAATNIFDADTYEFSVSAIGRIGQFIEIATQEFIVNDCYGVSVNIDAQEDIYDCAGYHEYPLIIRNTGTEEEDIKLEVFGSDYARVDEPTFTLGANDSVTLTLILDVPLAVALDTSLTVQATVLDMESITAEDSIGVIQLDEIACFTAKIKPLKERISYLDASAFFTLENVGLGLAAYEVSFVGDEFFTLTKESEFATLWPGEKANITLLTYQNGPNASARYDAVINVFARSVDGNRVLQYEFPVTVTLHARFILLRWYDAAYVYFSAHLCQFVSAVALLLLLIAGLIIGLRKKVQRKTTKGLLLGLVIAWIILVVLAFYFYGVPTPLYDQINASNDPLTIRFAEDTSYDLNLMHYFIDEDGDSLLFDISSIDNISVLIENTTATFTPEKDWNGERRFRITAFDGEGGETESPRLNVEVIDRPEYSIWDLYNKYCLYVNLVLILLLFLLVNSLFRQRVLIKQEPVKKKVTLKKKIGKKKQVKKKK